MALLAAHHGCPAAETAEDRTPAPKAVALFGANFFVLLPLQFPKAGDPELLGRLEKRKKGEEGEEEKEQVLTPRQRAQPRLVPESIHSECCLILLW